MTATQTTLQQDLGSLAADLVSAGNHEGAALVTSAANVLAASSEPVAIPTNDALEALWQKHAGHPADFGADVLETFGGYPAGLLGFGGSLSTIQPVQAKALTDDLYILSMNEEAMEEAIQRFKGSSTGEALKLAFAAQKSLRALLASQLWADMSTCKHVFMAVPIGDSRAANVPAKAVCMHCGYEPQPQADGEQS